MKLNIYFRDQLIGSGESDNGDVRWSGDMNRLRNIIDFYGTRAKGEALLKLILERLHGYWWATSSDSALSIQEGDQPDIVSPPELMMAGLVSAEEVSSGGLNLPPRDESKDAPKKEKPEKFEVQHDWDELEAIVVGRIENDTFPPDPWQPSVEGLPKEGNIRYADFAPDEWALAVKNLNNLVEILEKEGVEVYRPPLVSVHDAMRFPVGLTQVYVREAFTVIGTTVVPGQSRTPYRRKESLAVEELFAGSADILRLPSTRNDKDDSPPDDPEPYIEGGDIYRLGKDVLITISGLASSPAGVSFLSKALADKGLTVWPAYIKQPFEHGDYILMLVREGLCIAHRRGFIDGLLPSPILDWDCVEITEEEADPGMAANGIVLRENVVLLPTGNKRVVRALEKKGVDVIEVPFDGVEFFQGSIDCATSEVRRAAPGLP